MVLANALSLTQDSQAENEEEEDMPTSHNTITIHTVTATQEDPVSTLSTHGENYLVKIENIGVNNSTDRGLRSSRRRVQLGTTRNLSDRGQLGLVSKLYRNEIVLEAASCIGVFIFTYGAGMEWQQIVLIPSLHLQIFSISTFPLGVDINKLIYARLKVPYLRQVYGCYWLRGLLLVLRAGAGKVPNILDDRCWRWPKIPSMVRNRAMHETSSNDVSSTSSVARPLRLSSLLSYDRRSTPDIRRPWLITLGIVTLFPLS